MDHRPLEPILHASTASALFHSCARPPFMADTRVEDGCKKEQSSVSVSNFFTIQNYQKFMNLSSCVLIMDSNQVVSKKNISFMEE